tara:strand:- start:714 stop:971 length:258 start_codon:yes stop_codon:yes gene_type:complete
MANSIWPMGMMLGGMGRKKKKQTPTTTTSRRMLGGPVMGMMLAHGIMPLNKTYIRHNKKTMQNNSTMGGSPFTSIHAIIKRLQDR